MKNNDEREEDYEVGYRKPPKSGQFKKGVSGNPSGRPRKESDFDDALLRELNSRLTIRENGQRKVITKSDALAKQLVNKAFADGGHLPSIRMVDKLRREALAKKAEKGDVYKKAEELTDEELTAIILAETRNRDIVDKMRQEKANPLPPTDPDI